MRCSDAYEPGTRFKFPVVESTVHQFLPRSVRRVSPNRGYLVAVAWPLRASTLFVPETTQGIIIIEACTGRDSGPETYPFFDPKSKCRANFRPKVLPTRINTGEQALFRLSENSGKSPVTQVQNRGFWGCRRKSAETPVFMRVGRRFCPQLEPHLGFVSKNGSSSMSAMAIYRQVAKNVGNRAKPQ